MTKFSFSFIQVRLIPLVSLVFAFNVYPQLNLESLDFTINGRIISACSNNLMNKLVFGGDFNQLNHQESSAIIEYSNGGFSNIGTGYVVGQVYTMTFFRDTLFIGGHDPNRWVRYWSGNEWVKASNDSVFGQVIDLEVINDELWVAGYFDSIGDLKAHGLARWDGQTWKTAYDIPIIDSIEDLNRINTVCEYQGEIYVGGNFTDLNGEMNEIARWDGSNWKDVGGGIKPGTFSAVFNLIVFKNELYVMGRFLASEGNADDNIMRWNGEEWLPCGGGVFSSAAYATVFDDKLWVTGQLSSAAGMPASGLAVWDGEEWCVPDNQFDSWPGPLIGFNDSLFIGGSFQTIDGDSFSYLAKTKATGQFDTCGVLPPIGVNERYSDYSLITVFPNPVSEVLTVNISGLEGYFDFEIFSLDGRRLHRESRNVNNELVEIPVNFLSSGIYILHSHKNGESFNVKFVKN